MVYYNNEIGVLPQETKEYKKNTREDEQYPSEQNEMSEKALKKQVKKPKLTTEQFQQHLNADPKLKAAYAEHQVLMDRQKQANERVKNTGYLGTLWGGITGDSGIDDLVKINEDMNSANTKFRNALDQNSGLSQDLKKQLIGYKLGADSGLNAATAQAAGGFSERAENYAAGTKAVRNTAIGAGLVVGAVVAAPTIAAVAGVGGGATLGGGTATMSTVLGASAGGAILMHPIGTGLNVVGEEGQVVYDALKKDQTKTFAHIQNDQEVGMFDRSLERGNQFAKVGMTAPVALAAGPGAVVAGGAGRMLATGVATTATGVAIGAAYGAGRKEVEITLDAVRNPDPGKGKFDSWIDKNKAGFPAMREQTKEYAKYGAAFGATMATPLGRPLAASAGVLGVAEGGANTVDNLIKSTGATGSEKIKAQNEALLSMTDTAFAGFGSKALLKASSGTKIKGSASPEPSITPRTNRDVLGLGPKNGAENSRRNPKKPIEGQTLPESGQIFRKAASTTPVESGFPKEPRFPHETHQTEILADGTKIIQGDNRSKRGPYQNSRIEISPDGSYKYNSRSPNKQGEFATRIVNKEAKVIPESGDSRPLTFFDQRGYGRSGLEPRLTRKEGFDPESAMNFKDIRQTEGLYPKAKITSFARPGEKPIMPASELKSALNVELPKDRKIYKERAQKQREEAQNDHPKKASVPQNLPRQDIDVTWNQDGTRTVQAGGFDRKNNYRIVSNDYPIDGMRARSGSIIKGTPEGSSVLSYRIGVDGKRAKGYTYEKKGSDGTIQAARVNDGRGNGISEVLKPDESSSIRTYQRTPMGILSTFDGGNNQRVSTTSKDGNKIMYGFEQSSIPGAPGKTYQTIRNPDGTVLRGEATISGDNSKKILYTPPKGSSELPDHLKTVTKPEQVPQKPSTPPENLKNITLDPDELIKKRSLKK